MENAPWWTRASCLFWNCSRPRRRDVARATGEKLVKAAEAGDLDALKELFATLKPRVEISMHHRETALVMACHHGHEEAVIFLLTEPRVAMCAEHVASALVRAASCGQFGAINQLAALSPEAFLTEQATLALLRAVQNGNHLCTRMLLRGGVPADASLLGGLPVLFSAAVSSSQCVIELLKAGADMNVVDENGQTPLHHAAACNEMECMEELVWAGANRKAVDEEGNLPRDEAISERARDLLDPNGSPRRRPRLREVDPEVAVTRLPRPRLRVADPEVAIPGPSSPADPDLAAPGPSSRADP